MIFGWFWVRGPEAGRRVVRQVLLEIARKNGKSTLAAGIAWLMLVGDGGQGVEVYSAAADKEQARIVFDDAIKMGRASPELDQLAEFLRTAIVTRTGAYKALSADAETKHGLRPSGVIFDELHTQKNRHLYDVLHTAVGAQPQPLEIYITTAGVDRNSICYEVHEYATRVRDGLIDDLSFLPVIFAADEADDFTDPFAWAKANPSLGHAVRYEFLEAESRAALERPSYQNTFRRLYMNQWTESVSSWIGQNLWRSAQVDPSEPWPDLTGRPCYGGLDLGSKKDLSALTLTFPPEDPTDETSLYHVEVRIWSPEDTLAERERVDRVPYPLWVEQGHLLATPGRVIDHSYIAAELAQIAAKYDLQQLAFDPWQMAYLEREIDALGLSIPLVKHGQGFQGGGRPDALWMPRSVDEFERLLLTGRLRIRNNPCLDFAAASAVLESDPKGNRCFTKRKSTGRIDPLVSGVMSVGAATTVEVQPKNYWETMSPLAA